MILNSRSKVKIIGEKESGWVVRDTTFNRGETELRYCYEGPRQCPLVLLVNVGWKRGKTFGFEEGRDERWSRKKS
jgi:hypothetical protein